MSSSNPNGDPAWLGQVKFDANGLVPAVAVDAERGDVHEELDIGIEGNELSIAFNSRYLTDIIHNIDDERICMCFNSNVSPCMIKPVKGEQFTFLVLPVRIKNEN